MNESENRNVNINFKFQRSGDRETMNTFKQVQRGIDDARKASAQLTSQLRETQQVNLNALEDEAEQFTRQMQQAKEETRAVANELKKVNQQPFAGGRSNSSGSRSESQQFVGNAVGDVVGDILQGLVGDIEPLRNVANQAGNSVGDLVSKLGPQGVALAPVALGATIAIGGVVAALAYMRQHAEAAKEATERGMDELERFYGVITNGTKESVEKARDNLRQQQDVAQAQLDVLLPIQQEIKDFFEDGIVQALNPDELNSRVERIRETLSNLGFEVGNKFDPKVLDERITELQTSLDNGAKWIDRYNDAIDSGSLVSEAAFKRFTESAQNFAANIQRYIDTQKQLAEANKAVADAEAERLKTIQKRQQEDIRAAQVADLERRIQQAQEKEAAEARKQRIVDLRSEGADAEAQILAKNNERMQQINEQFMANGLKALQRYLLAEQRATEDYNTNRVRKLQDLYDTLTDLAAQRDVAAFVSTRRSGLRDIQRGDEDFGTAARRRREDYDNERREALAARQQQIDELRAAGQQELAERRQQLQQRIDDEIAAGEIELKQSEVLQQQLTALRARFAAQDLADRRRTEDEAYRTQLANLRNRQAEITRIINTTFSPAVTAVGNIGTALVNMVNNVRSAAAAPVASLGQQSVQVGRNYITAYDGGTRSVPVSGLYHLRRGESVLTINETNRMNRGDYQFARRGQGVTVNINATFGEIVTPSQMDAQIGAVVDGIRLAVNGG